jgi:hypothetical protein
MMVMAELSKSESGARVAEGPGVDHELILVIRALWLVKQVIDLENMKDFLESQLNEESTWCLGLPPAFRVHTHLVV